MVTELEAWEPCCGTKSEQADRCFSTNKPYPSIPFQMGRRKKENVESANDMIERFTSPSASSTLWSFASLSWTRWYGVVYYKGEEIFSLFLDSLYSTENLVFQHFPDHWEFSQKKVLPSKKCYTFLSMKTKSIHRSLSSSTRLMV